MVKLEDIDYAIDKTLEVHPDFISGYGSSLASQVNGGVRSNSFTSQGGARRKVQGMEPDDLLRYIMNETVKIYNAACYFYNNDPTLCSLRTTNEKMNYLLEVFPYFGEIQRIMKVLELEKVNAALYLKMNNNDLFALAHALVQTRFDKKIPYREYIDKCGKVCGLTPSGRQVDMFAKIDKDMQIASLAKEISVNHRAVNKCLQEIMSGNQLKNQRNEYALEGTLFAAQDIGRVRHNQEDTTLILAHPQNPNFKFLSVADGMGGVQNGEAASLYISQTLAQWFNGLPADLYYYPEEVQKLFNQEIMKISDDIYFKYNRDYAGPVAGATFVGAIVTQDKTIVSSVGDSRAYTYGANGLKLITMDESRVWPIGVPANELTDQQIDDLRFRVHNNQICRFIGQQNGVGTPQSYMIPNQAYERLMLFSDGVTDLLSMDEIRVIARNTPNEQLAKEFVETVLNRGAVRNGLPDEFHRDRIAAGKDNASAAVMVKGGR